MTRCFLAIVVCIASVSFAVGGDAKKEARAKEIRAEIAAIKAKLLALEKELEALVPVKSFAGETLYVDEIKIGAKGVLTYPENDGRRGMPLSGVVDTILDGSSFVLFHRFGESRYLVVVMPTKGLVDEAKIDLNFPVHITGTRRIGSRTYFVAERIK